MTHFDERTNGLALPLLAVSLLAFCGQHSGSHAAPPAATVSWAPAHPVQGSAVVVIVRPEAASGADSGVAVHGTLAGEPLRFERDHDGGFRALGAFPVNARAQVLVPIEVVFGSGDTVPQVARIPVGAGGFRLEHLRLPRRFVTPPRTLLPRLREERRTIHAALSRTSGTPRLWDTTFVRPLAGPVTDRFGTRRVLNGKTSSRHLGVDLKAKRGEPIHAANRGVVIASGRFYYQGNAVYIDHGGGLVTVYMHMSHRLVAPGDTVRAGQVIGLVGATGRVTGPHLHWTAYFGRVLFNPLSLLTLPVEDLTAFTS
jgi:Peptidase family M23